MGRKIAMTIAAGRHDRLIGAACLFACPALSGLFLGLIAVVCVSPAGGAHPVAIGAVVGTVAFVANAFAICLTATAIHGHAQRRAHRTSPARLTLVPHH